MIPSKPANRTPNPTNLAEVAVLVRALLDSANALDLDQRLEDDLDTIATIQTDLESLRQIFDSSQTQPGPVPLEAAYAEEIMQSMMEAVVVAKQDGTIQCLNEAAQKLLAYQGLELIGQPLSVLTEHAEETPEETQTRGRLLGELFTEGALQDLTVRAKTKDGLTIPMSVNVTLLRTEEAHLQGILLVAQDTRETHRLTQEARGAVQAEAARTKQLEQAYEALDRAHQDLTNTQSQLIQTGRLAAVGELGAGIAHELNQPLTTIQGFAQRMRAHPEDLIGKYVDELDLILHGAERMARIVNNIRRFARQESFDANPIDPFTPCRAALELVSEQLRLHSIEVRVPEVVYLPLVMGDAIQLEQVFLNLLTNARDALDQLPPDQKRIIDLSSDVESTFAIVRVADNGPGIPPGVTSKIFDPFFTTKPPGQGTGLGLSIVHGILRDHGGHISYKPNPGGGCIFEIRLPVTTPDAPKEPRERLA